jgi:hypothetical protein
MQRTGSIIGINMTTRQGKDNAVAADGAGGVEGKGSPGKGESGKGESGKGEAGEEGTGPTTVGRVGAYGGTGMSATPMAWSSAVSESAHTEGVMVVEEFVPFRDYGDEESRMEGGEKGGRVG